MLQRELELRLLLLLIGIGVTYITADTYRKTRKSGWWYVKIAFVALSMWAFSVLFLGFFGLPGRYVADGLGVFGMGLSLFFAAVAFIVQDDELSLPYQLTVNPVKHYVLAVFLFAVGGGALIASARGVFTGLYMAALLLLLPALGGFFMVHRAARTRMSAAAVVGTFLLTAGHAANIYSTMFCGRDGPATLMKPCAQYAYEFAAMPLFSFEPTVLTATTVSGPVITFAGALLWIYAVYVHHHHTMLRWRITEAINEIGDITSPKEAHQIAVNAMKRVYGMEIRPTDDIQVQVTAPDMKDRRFTIARREIVTEFGTEIRGDGPEDRQPDILSRDGRLETGTGEETSKLEVLAKRLRAFVKKFFNTE